MSRSSILSTNHQGSTLRGAGGSPRAYSPYGYLAQQGAPLTSFAGQTRDPITGLYHLGNGHRSYSPVTMRFLSPDSLSPFDEGGINAYAYCLGDPVNYRDPTGRAAQEKREAEDYVLPGLAILTNVLGIFISALRFRSLVKQYKAVRRSPLDSIAPSIPEPTKANWVLSGISAFSGTAGLTVSVSRTVDPEKDWQLWALVTLTSISVLTSAYEALRLYKAKPWQPDTPTTQTRLSEREPSPLPVGVAQIRGT